MPIVKHTATDYHSASLAREYDLQHLLKDRHSRIFSLYCAGLAIECILRAYITKYTKEFDEKHNLEKLYQKSQIANLLNDKEKEEIAIAIKLANRIWKNELRYTSEKRMKRILGHELAKSRVRDINHYIDEYYSDLFKATQLIIKTGNTKWT